MRSQKIQWNHQLLDTIAQASEITPIQIQRRVLTLLRGLNREIVCECVSVSARRERLCEAIIHYLIKDGYRIEVPKHQVQKVIRILIGIDPRTQNSWLQILEDLEYLIPQNSIVYRINPIVMSKEIFQKLKEDPQTKLQ